MATTEILSQNIPREDQKAPQVQEKSCHPEATDSNIQISINQLKLHGVISSSTGVASYLNVPFARIPGRFREAKIIEPRKEVGILNCTEFGPICPQDVDTPHQATKHLYPNILSETSSGAEYTCLNLNIYTPPDATSSKSPLPVLVWIHGGAFHYGANTDEYDGNYIVQHAMQIGKPIIVVSLNYRLGYYGFLTSRELRDEAMRLGEKGHANLALHDQRLGLEWVQRNIKYFRGDGYNVTCAGESAGACSILMHLRSDFPAFQRAFILSPAAVSLADEGTAQAAFDQLVEVCGMPATAPASQKLDALRSLTSAEFNKLTPVGVIQPIWDAHWFVDQSSQPSVQDSRPFPSWAQQIVIGAAKEEMALFGLHWAEWTGSQAVAKLKAFMGDTAFVQKVLDTYGFQDDDVPGSSLDSLIQLASDFFFKKVAYDVAAGHPELPVSLYSFEQIDSFPQSPFKGRAYHSLGNSMFFRLPTVVGPKSVDPSTELTSNKMCEAAIRLAYGEQPWQPYLHAHKVMTFNGGQTGLIETPGKPAWADIPLTAENKELLNNAIRDLIVF